MPTFGIPCDTPDLEPCREYLYATIPLMNEVVANVLRPLIEVIDRNNTILTEVIKTTFIPIEKHKKDCNRRINAVTRRLEGQCRANMRYIASLLESVIAHLPEGTTVEEITLPVEQGGGVGIQVNGPVGTSSQIGLPIGFPPPPSVSPPPPIDFTIPVSFVAPVSSSDTSTTNLYPGGFLQPPTPGTGGYGGTTIPPPAPPPQLQPSLAPVITLPEHPSVGTGSGAAVFQATTFTGFRCPDITASNIPAHGILGTPEWCADSEKVILWLHAAGQALVVWLKDSLNPSGWKAVVEKLAPPKSNTSLLADIERGFIHLLTAAVDLAAKGVQLVIDLIQCAVTWAEFLTPIRDVPAYIALLTIKNIIGWVRDSRIGSQSYLGVTVAAALQIPQFETYLNRMLDYLCCVEIPSVAETIEAYTVDTIKDKQYECLLRLNGVDPRMYEPFRLARSDRLTASESIEYARRFGADEKQTLELLHRAGWSDPIQAQKREQLYDELPSVADHLHWLQRNVFDTDYVRTYHLLDGFEERFWAQFGTDLYAQGYTKKRAQYEYAAHWIMPAPHQMLEFVYRLRKGRDPNGVTFTIDDYKRILAEQDYNVLAREWFAATAHKVPALSYLRDMHRMDLLSDAQMREYHSDLGYAQADSEKFVAVDTLRKRRMQATQGAGWNPAALKKAYSVGQIDDRFVAQQMSYLGFSAQASTDLMDRSKADYQYSILVRARSRLLTTTITTISTSMDVGILDKKGAADALQKLGWTQKQAEGIAGIEATKNAAKRAARIVRAIGRAYTAGEITEQFARNQLAKVGILSERIGQYISEWQLEQTPGHRRLSASQIVTEVARGELNPDEAKVRLHNLRYSDSDISLKLADAAYATVQTDEAMALADQLGGSARSAKHIELTEKQIGLARTSVARLKAMEPPAKLLKWLKDGVKGVTCDYVRRRMRIYGWDNSSIDKWLAEHGCAPETDTHITQTGSENAPAIGPGASPTPASTGAGEMHNGG